MTVGRVDSSPVVIPAARLSVPGQSEAKPSAGLGQDEASVSPGAKSSATGTVVPTSGKQVRIDSFCKAFKLDKSVLESKAQASLEVKKLLDMLNSGTGELRRQDLAKALAALNNGFEIKTSSLFGFGGGQEFDNEFLKFRFMGRETATADQLMGICEDIKLTEATYGRDVFEDWGSEEFREVNSKGLGEALKSTLGGKSLKDYVEANAANKDKNTIVKAYGHLKASGIENPTEDAVATVAFEIGSREIVKQTQGNKGLDYAKKIKQAAAKAAYTGDDKLKLKDIFEALAKGEYASDQYIAFAQSVDADHSGSAPMVRGASKPQPPVEQSNANSPPQSSNTTYTYI